MQVAEMCINYLHVAPMTYKIREKRLAWFVHVKKGPNTVPIRRLLD